MEVIILGKRVLIIGGGSAGSQLIQEYQSKEHLQIVPVAILDDNILLQNSAIHGVPVVGTIPDVIKISKEYIISDIIIAIPSASCNRIREIITECMSTKCNIKILDAKMCQSGRLTVRSANIEDLLSREPIRLNLEEIGSLIRDKVVLVSGGGGTIGSELCRQIVMYNPAKILILDNNENGAYELQQEILRVGAAQIELGTNKSVPYNGTVSVEVIIGSVQDINRLEKIFIKYRPDIFFHAAAHKHVPVLEHNPFEAIKNNIFGTYNCVKMSDKYKVEKFILISTDKAVNPSSIMGASKRICELICMETNKTSNTNFSIVRFGNVLGSNGSVLPLFQKQFNEGGPLIVTHPDVKRYFMTVNEATQMILQCSAMSDHGEIFILDMGEAVKIYDIARDFIRLSGLEPGVDMDIIYSGLRPGEKLNEELHMVEEELCSTHHNRISVGKERLCSNMKDSSSLFFSLLGQLEAVTEQEDAPALSKLIKQLVPNYENQSL